MELLRCKSHLLVICQTIVYNEKTKKLYSLGLLARPTGDLSFIETEVKGRKRMRMLLGNDTHAFMTTCSQENTYTDLQTQFCSIK